MDRSNLASRRSIIFQENNPKPYRNDTLQFAFILSNTSSDFASNSNTLASHILFINYIEFINPTE